MKGIDMSSGIHEYLGFMWYVTKADGELFVELDPTQPKVGTAEFNEIASRCENEEFIKQLEDHFMYF